MDLKERKKFKTLLKDQLLRRGISSKALAEIVNAKQTQIEGFFEKNVALDFFTVAQMLQILNIHLSDIIVDEKKPVNFIQTSMRSKQDITLDLKERIEQFLLKNKLRRNLSNISRLTGVSEGCIRRLMNDNACPTIENQMKLYDFLENPRF